MDSLKLILSKYRYFAPAWVFASINILIGTWVLYIPRVKEKLSLNDSELGLAIFFLALGILTFLPLAPYLSRKVGTGRYTKIGIILFAISFIFPLLAPNYTLLCLSLFIVGAFSGTTDIAMNALVSEIEKKDSRNFMSATHGFFSLGGVIGTGVGSLLIAFNISPFWHMLSVASFIIITNLLLSKHYHLITEERPSGSKAKYNFKNLKPLFGLALIAFIVMNSEGAVEHWSGLYLLEVVKINSENLAGLGFIIFSSSMTIGRFFGDKISEGIGSMKIILLGLVVAIVGYGFILYSTFLVTIIGFGILGLGLSVLVPELFRIAGKTKGVSSSLGISFVSGLGFIGFLAGPVVLGFISNSSSLRMSYVFLLFLIFIALIVSIFQMKLANRK